MSPEDQLALVNQNGDCGGESNPRRPTRDRREHYRGRRNGEPRSVVLPDAEHLEADLVRVDREIDGVADAMQTLRRLKANRLVDRRAFAEAPPRVEYSLTELGQTLQEPIVMLTRWARNHGEAIVDFRELASDEPSALENEA